MRVFTAHVRGRRAPVLVHEGFSWAALVFGPLWFAVRGAWVAAAVDLLLWVLLLAFVHGPVTPVLAIALVVAAGLFGQDLRRLGLDWRGYLLAHVVAAPDEDAAFARLLDARPDLVGPRL